LYKYTMFVPQLYFTLLLTADGLFSFLLIVCADSQTFKMGSYSCRSHHVHGGRQVRRRRYGIIFSNLCLKKLVALLSQHFIGPSLVRAGVTPSRSVFW